MKWNFVKLGELCEFYNGKAHEKDISEDGEFIVVNSKFISSDGNTTKFTNKQMFPLHAGDIVMVMSDVPNGKALAKTMQITENRKYSLNQRICCIRSSHFHPKFLKLFLNRHPHFLKFNNGENQTNLRKNDILECPIPKLRLTEQQRILAKLEKAFAEIDKGITIANKKIRHAQTIFENSVRKYFQVDKNDSKFIKLSEVAEYFNGLTYSPKDVVEDGIIVLRSSNIQNGQMDFTDIVRVKKNIKEKLFVKPNDILICSRNGSKRLIGKCSLIGEQVESMTFGTFMMIVRSDLSFYLIWFFKSHFFKEQITFGENTMINQITRYMLDEERLPIVSQENQIIISKKLSAIDEFVRLINELENKKIQNFITLKKSILMKEFKHKAA